MVVIHNVGVKICYEKIERVCVSCLCFEREIESGSRFLFRISIHGILKGLDYSGAPLIVDSPL